MAYSFSKRKELALISGLLAVFSIYYVPFLPVTDNYDPYLILGGLFFLTLGSHKFYSYFILGALVGLLTLARSLPGQGHLCGDFIHDWLSDQRWNRRL